MLLLVPRFVALDFSIGQALYPPSKAYAERHSLQGSLSVPARGSVRSVRKIACRSAPGTVIPALFPFFTRAKNGRRRSPCARRCPYACKGNSGIRRVALRRGGEAIIPGQR